MTSFHQLLETHSLTAGQIYQYLEAAATFIDADKNIISQPILQGKTVANVFFETSTRTRSAFELAVKHLSGQVLNFNVAQSAASKGESLLDTLRNLEALQCEIFVLRHPDSGAAHFASQVLAPHTAIINAGDGCHAHPTQALTDIFTISQYKKDFSSLKVAIVGDILHSRVARSQIHLLNHLGTAEIRVIAPATLMPPYIEKLGVHAYTSLTQGLKEVDVIIMLRLQKERMQQGLLPPLSAYFNEFGLTAEKLAQLAPHALIMHPGPINRGVEIASEVVEGSQSIILQQVRFGLAMRMAVLALAVKERSGETLCRA